MKRDRAESSGARKRRAAWNYDSDVPRCSSCVHYRHGTPWNPNGLPASLHQQYSECTLGKFRVSPLAVCDKWTNRHGDTLE